MPISQFDLSHDLDARVTGLLQGSKRKGYAGTDDDQVCPQEVLPAVFAQPQDTAVSLQGLGLPLQFLMGTTVRYTHPGPLFQKKACRGLAQKQNLDRPQLSAQ